MPRPGRGAGRWSADRRPPRRLEELGSDGALAAVPAVTLATSDEEADIVASHQQHAAAYGVKPPMGLGGFTKIVDAIERFWFEVVLLPPRED